ncbi:MAG: metallophosphoesterase family protein [Myxococcales bacterium]|jgi:hypothetical protein
MQQVSTSEPPLIVRAQSRPSRPSPPDPDVPPYRGFDWVKGRLPRRSEPWLRTRDQLVIAPGFYMDEAARDDVHDYAREKPWVWPARRHFFLSDIHADADALQRSLVASGAVEKTGPGDHDFQLTEQGRAGVFVVAGDCFDKGPSNLRLLRALKHLIDLGADVQLLAGNHDVRALVGMSCLGAEDTLLAHLFVRMGKKTVPLFKEIHDEYLSDRNFDSSPEQERRLHDRMFPPQSWYREWPEAVRGMIPDKKIEHELVRIREKTRDLETHCERAGLSLAAVEAAADKFHELFLTPGGEFAWFFERMQLAYRAGSFLFVHAGVDDDVALQIRRQGVEGVNRRFRELLDGRELFELYHGDIGNVFRTKYRDTDRPLTPTGVHDLHCHGIYAVVHGHRNIVHGQRIVFRAGLLNFECDASVDRNTRRIEDLEGLGGAVTIFREDGCVLGVSTDFRAVKVFDAARSAGVFVLTSAC